MTAWLTPEEVGELTASKPRAWRAQRKRLSEMGVPFRPNAAGRPLVERAAVLRYREPAVAKATAPNWDGIKAA